MIVTYENKKVRVRYVSTDKQFLLVCFAHTKTESLFKINVDELDLESDKKRVRKKAKKTHRSLTGPGKMKKNN